MKKLTKKNFAAESVELFEERYSCPCSCAGCGCTICSPNDVTWMNTVLYSDDVNYDFDIHGYETNIH